MCYNMKHKILCPGMSYVFSRENKVVFEVFYIASQYFKAISTDSHSAVFHNGLEELICLTITNDKGDLGPTTAQGEIISFLPVSKISLIWV